MTTQETVFRLRKISKIAESQADGFRVIRTMYSLEGFLVRQAKTNRLSLSKNNSNYNSTLWVPRMVPKSNFGNNERCLHLRKIISREQISLQWKIPGQHILLLASLQSRFTNIAPHGDLSYAPVLPATTMPPLSDPAEVVVHPPQSEDFGT